MSFSLLDSILQQMAMVYEDNHWHAPLQRLLATVDADLAARRPAQGGHTIYELVHHLAYSMEEVSFRVSGRPGQWIETESWVAAPDALTPERWQASLDRLAAARDAFRSALSALDEETLARPSGDRPSPFELALQLIHHEAFHAGQIAYIRRLFGYEAVM